MNGLHCSLTGQNSPVITFATHAHIFIPQIVFVVVVQESKLLNRHAGSVTRALILKRDGGDPAIANKYTSSHERLERLVTCPVDTTAWIHSLCIGWTKHALAGMDEARS